MRISCSPDGGPKKGGRIFAPAFFAAKTYFPRETKQAIPFRYRLFGGGKRYIPARSAGASRCEKNKRGMPNGFYLRRSRELPRIRHFCNYLLPTKKATPERVSLFWWWEEVDSNYRSRRRQIYSLIHLAALESSRI